MPVRTNSTDVLEILDPDANAAASELDNQFIPDANALVNEHLLNRGLGSDLLERIEKYVAAHLVAVAKRPVASERAMGDRRERFQRSRDGRTDYWRTAEALDSTGTLASLDAEDRSTLVWRVGAQ